MTRITTKLLEIQARASSLVDWRGDVHWTDEERALIDEVHEKLMSVEPGRDRS